MTLHRLRALGVGLEIGSFGTGNASPGYLRRLPFDALRIDRSFVKQLGTINDSSGIIDTILIFAGSLGMKVDAEGVETKEQADKLVALGCCRVQGPYFSGPSTPRMPRRGSEESPEAMCRRGVMCARFLWLLPGLAGTPERIRTSDLLLRRQTLYPAELRVHVTRFYRKAGRPGGIAACYYFGVSATANKPERWLSGRKQRFAKPS